MKRTSIKITLLGLVAVVGLVFGGMYIANYFVSSFFVETYELKGDPTHFDPLASINEIRSHFDVHAKLASLRLDFVRPDGTMDLKANYKPLAEYEFYRELAEAPKNAPPVGAGGTTGKWYERVQADVYEPGRTQYVESSDAEYSYTNKGIELSRSTNSFPGVLLDDPHCSLVDFWKIALQKGAAAQAVATIRYDRDGYDFSIGQTSIDLQFGLDCQLKSSI